MVLHWNNERYQKVNMLVSIILLGGIAGVMYSWYFNVLTNKLLIFAIIPVGLAHLYNRKLESLLQTHDGAQIKIEKKRLILTRPNQDYEAIIKFRDIVSVKSSHWLFLEKIKLSLKSDKEIELINFNNQKSILNKINAL